MWSGDECCEQGGNLSRDDVRRWLEEFPATREIAGAIAGGVCRIVRDELRRWRTDTARFDTNREALRWALVRGRQLALVEVMAMKPIQPLLAALAKGTKQEQEDYRVLLLCYVDRLPLAAIGRVLGAAATTRTVIAGIAAVRVREAYERWNGLVGRMFPAGAGRVAFPPPEQL